MSSLDVKDSLGERMKRYENVFRHHLVARTPVVIRVDGRAFHTLTATLEKPFSAPFFACMASAATSLCEAIAGAQIAYVQSDEISVLVTDYATLETQGWFDYVLPKVISIAAATVSVSFLDMFRAAWPTSKHTPVFDARAWNLPKEEVTNYFIWRQNDARRNSIMAVAQATFSHKSLQGVSSAQAQARLLAEKGVRWEALPVWQQRGACVRREQAALGRRWVLDEAIPIFTQDRSYIDRFVCVDEEPVAVPQVS